MSGDESEAPPARSAAIATVSIKLPPFWPVDPDLWFAQVEAQFTTRGITAQKTKYDYIVASLSPEVATQVRDLIITPPTITPYDTLRKQLTRRTTPSQQQKLQQLLSTDELGDRKPSQLLRQMQQLLGDQAGDAGGTFLRELFLQRLPGNVRMVLASTDATTTLENLAALADKVMEVAITSISAVTTPRASLEMDELRAEVSRLQDVVKSLSSRSQPPFQAPRRRSPSPVRPHKPTDAALCWYHQKYGDQAQRCRPPCTKALNFQASH
jgi:hypothetical protein